MALEHSWSKVAEVWKQEPQKRGTSLHTGLDEGEHMQTIIKVFAKTIDVHDESSALQKNQLQDRNSQPPAEDSTWKGTILTTQEVLKKKKSQQVLPGQVFLRNRELKENRDFLPQRSQILESTGGCSDLPERKRSSTVSHSC